MTTTNEKKDSIMMQDVTPVRDPSAGSSISSITINESTVEANDATQAEASEAAEAEVVPPPYSIYKPWEKKLIVVSAAIGALISSSLAQQIYLPALNTLADEFQVTVAEINLTITVFMLFQGVVPMFVGGFADNVGRRPAYVICFVIYFASNIGLASVNKYGSLMVVRAIQSIGATSTQALCQAVIADIITSAERGQYTAYATLPNVLGPSLGPVIGGALSQYLGWRSIFYFLGICSAIYLALLVLFFPETCRKVVGDGSIRPRRRNQTLWQLIKDYREKKRVGPHLIRVTTSASAKQARKEKQKSGLTARHLITSLMLLFEKELGLLLTYSGLAFAGLYTVATAIPSHFANIYGFDGLKIGLVYLPMAIGSIAAVAVVGPGMNWNFRRHAKRLGLSVDKTRQMDLSEFPIEKARIEIVFPFLFLYFIVLLSWGWVLESEVTVAVPIVLIFFLGVGFFSIQNITSALITDVHPSKAGSGAAANNIVRCFLGAAWSAAIEPLISAVGPGFAYTIVAMLYVIFLPCLLLVMRYGMQWRKEAREKEAAKEAAKQEAQVELGRK